MKIKTLLVAAGVAATVANASAFKWEPMGLSPYPSMDVTSLYSLENVGFQVYEVDGLSMTEVMPLWVDEDGTEIKAVGRKQNPWGWNPNEFNYSFNMADFKANGEYTLVFPEGMLVNGAGEKSDKVETYYTFDIPDLNPPMFDDFKVLSITPDLTQPQAVWNDQKITINTNHNEAVGMTMLTITDNTTGEIVVTSSSYSMMRELGTQDPISWEVVNTYKFYEGHDYQANIVFYNGMDEFNEMGEPTRIVDRVSYTFTGRVEGFKYSSVELLSVEPAPMSIVISEPDQAVFTYTFSAPVNVYQAETPLGQFGKNVYPASCLSSNDDKTVWTLDLSNDEFVKTVDAQLTIYIYARDLDGFQLKGNWGEEYQSCFQDSWQCDLGAFPVVVATPVIGSTIDRLSEVVIKSESGEAMAWSWMGEVNVVNQLGDILGTLVYEEPEGEDSNAAMEEIRFTKWIDQNFNEVPIDLVKEGYYAIQISAGCFLMGEEFESKQSRSLTSTFIVSGALDEPEPGVDPAEQEVFNFDKELPEEGATVTSLSRIQLWYPEMVACNEFDVNVYNAADGSLAATATGMYDWDDILLINIDLKQPIAEAGVYEVVIPARVISDDAFFSSDGASGICNPEIKLSYTVAPNGGSAVETVAVAAEGDVYDVHGRVVLRNASAADMKALPKGIYIVGGRKLGVK